MKMEQLQEQEEESGLTIFNKRIFEAKQLAQIELMSNLGLSSEQELAEWIQANGERVAKLVRDPSTHLLDRLENPETHDDAII